MKLKYIIMIGILLFNVVGCGQKEEEHSSHEHGQQPNGDLREETASLEELPSFLADKSDEMKTIYQAAAAHQDLLEHIPCYCGCSVSGHRDNYDCFVHQVNEDGSIIWDDHGTRCGVCLETAATAVVEFQNGKSVSEIRDLIDNTYKEGYAEPTPTKRP